jgi:hypothetical protein
MGTKHRHSNCIADGSAGLILLPLLFGKPSTLVIAGAISGIAV